MLYSYLRHNLQLRDYYSILKLAPSASVDDIKSAYRRLAHIYHPDKNGNDAYAAAQFAFIKEAYETLTSPVKKDRYLQQRWYAQSTGQKRAATVSTPVTLLKKMLELDQYASRLDTHRMDREALYNYVCVLLSEEALEMLHSFNEPAVNKEILLSALRTSNHLPYSLLEPLSERLKKIPVDASASPAIDKALRHSREAAYWDKRRGLIMFIVVVLICLFIYFLSK